MLRPDMTLIHLTDTHVLPSDADRLYGEDTFANLRAAFDAVAERGVAPDAFLLSGDLANHGEPGSYARLRTLLDEVEDRFGVPALPAMGNHDDRRAFRRVLLGEGDGATDAPYYYSRRIGGLRVVVLDSTIPGRPHGAIDGAQLDWLRRELAEPAPAGTILVAHHTPLPGPVPVLNALILRDADALAAAVAGTDVIGLLAGHVHHPTVGVFAGVVCWAGPATAYTVDPLSTGGAGGAGDGFRGIAGGGLSLVHVYGRTMVASAVSLAGDQRELYRHELDEARLRRWLEAEPAPAPAAAAATAAAGS